MARNNRSVKEETSDYDAVGTDGASDANEPTLDGMPQALAAAQNGSDGGSERRQVPRELRPVFSEIARLSGILGIARNAVYANDAARAADALSVLEESASGARKIAQLVVPD